MAEAPFNPDEWLASKGTSPIPSALPSSTPVDPLQLQQFNPDQWLQNKETEEYNTLQAQHGTGTEQARAFAEAYARGASFGTSDIVATQLDTPENVAARQEANPITSFLGNMLGAGTTVGLTGGMAAPIETAFGGTLAARAAGYGAEGVLFGAGNLISDQQLGDPNLNAQKILTELGMGAVIGGGLGVLSKGIANVPALLRRAQAPEAAIEAVSGVTPPEIPPQPVVDLSMKGKAPTSIEEMDKLIQEQIKYGGEENLLEMPQRAEAADAMSRIGPDMRVPVTNMQLDSLANQDARNEFKTMLDLPGKGGATLRNYQGAQKKNLIQILDNTVKNISPGYEATTDAAEAGERAAKSFTDVIQGNRDALGPAFEQIKSTPLNDMNHLPGIIDYLTDTESSQYANSKISNMFDTGGETIHIKPYTTSMGIDKSTYTAIKQAVTSLEENPNDFETLFDIRKGLSQNVDVTKLGDSPKEIASAKAAMMDYIQDAVQSLDPDLAVRETFKNYAINEQNAQFIERKLGAEIGSDNFRSLAKGKAEENILKQIFKDSETVRAVKEILPEDKFNEMLADHLSILRNDMTDKGVFSSNKFFTALRKNQYALDEAFSKNPNAYQRIKDSLTLLRIFADDVPQNPSGTTKTLIQGMINAGLDPFKQLGNVLEYGKGKFEELRNTAEINQKLAETSDQTKKLSLIQSMINRVNKNISLQSKAIFEKLSSEGAKDTYRGMALSGLTQLTDKAYDEHVSKLQQFVSNPQTLMDHVASNSHSLYQAAPNITQSLHSNFVNGVQYLESKVPKQPQTFPLEQKWEPTRAQKLKFNQYYNAVNDPVSSLKQIKQGSLTNETMEALQVVHPQLLQEMRSKVLENMNPEKAKNLPYSQKLALSKFLGQPMVGSLTPQAMIANQTALNMQLSQQSAPKQGRKTNLGGLKQLNEASRTKTLGTREQESE